MFKDPICNMMVDEKKTKFISHVSNKIVYLCSASCKEKFEQNPQNYGY
jgi:YHS domain-containing protein